MITKRLATRRPHASDKLSDRHPYDPRDVDNIAAFASNVKGREVALAFKSRGPSKLVAALQRDDLPDEDIQEALSLLQGLFAHQTQKFETIKQGATDTCSNLLHHENVEIVCLAVQALEAIARTRHGREEILKHGSIAVIANDLLTSESAPLRERAAAFFESMAQCEDGAMMLLQDDAEAFLAGLRAFRAHCEPSAPLVRHTLPTIKSLASCIADTVRLKHAVTFLLDDGECNVEYLVNALQQKDDQMLLNVVTAITMIGRCDAGKASIIGYGGVGALCKLLSSNDTTIRIGVVCALRMLSSNKQGKPYYGEDEQVQQLVMALTDKNDVVKTEAAMTISTASENNNVLHKFVEKLAVYDELLQFVFPMDPRASQCLLDIIGCVSGEDATSDPNVVHSATVQLANELERDEGVALVLGTKRPVQSLAARIVHDETRTDTAVLCAKILQTMLANSKRAHVVLRSIVEQHQDQFEQHSQQEVQELYQQLMKGT